MLKRAFHELRLVVPRVNPILPIKRLHPSSSIFDDPFFNSPKESPAVNVIENKNDFVVEVEVPGLSKENLDLNVQEDTLTVSGSIESEPLENDSRAWNQEVI